MERLVGDKDSSTFGLFVSYEDKSFITFAPAFGQKLFIFEGNFC